MSPGLIAARSTCERGWVYQVRAWDIENNPTITKIICKISSVFWYQHRWILVCLQPNLSHVSLFFSPYDTSMKPAIAHHACCHSSGLLGRSTLIPTTKVWATTSPERHTGIPSPPFFHRSTIARYVQKPRMSLNNETNMFSYPLPARCSHTRVVTDVT